MRPRFVGLAVMVCFAPEAALAQCALCRDAVAAAPPQLREAMNYAIIGLALAPYAIALVAAWTLSPGFRKWVGRRFGCPAVLKTETRP